MAGRFGWFVLLFSLAIPAVAAGKPGAITGYVRSVTGVPQMGAIVEVLGSAGALRVLTDDHGFYSASGLLPGIYSVRVTAASFLPSIREQLGVRPGGSLLVNVTLNTLFEAIQLGAPRGPADDDDWKWTLRSVSNRPVLRLQDDGTPVLVADHDSNDRELKGSLAFVAGSPSDGYGSGSDMRTAFSVEHSVFSTGTLELEGNVGYHDGSSTTVLRTSYSHKMANGSEPEVAFTLRRLAAPDVNLRNASLQALSLTTADKIMLGDVLELRFGSELQTIQFMGRVNAFRPFGSAAMHLGPNTIVEYKYASSLPDARLEKGFDSAPADLSESEPKVSMAAYQAGVQRSQHQEVAVSRRQGKTNIQVAAYVDRVSNPALTGVGDVAAENGEVLPDLYSGTFTYQGRDLETSGMRVVLQRKLLSDLTATLDYAYGGVLDLSHADAELQNAREWMQNERRHSIAAKFSGTVPRSKTRWIASYRWVNGSALTPVDMFNTSAGRSDPYLNVFLRQPLPGTGFLPGKMEAIVDLRNLLAEGYEPVIGQDGRTVYLVQAARSVRGGVAFTF
ncbi:MAG TPA: carboxypeptidase-like regulatory domain-containing protein [Terriglobales bacterium]|jgi:Carboxypeptidase regulatory-like domain|nr:carboxypeptidase-like regulatory domain-containing protein [Terriglobales bacterium]